eukprot:SAG22_NODE_342_length_11973_cov_10.127927_11_plen_125_part_00
MGSDGLGGPQSGWSSDDDLDLRAPQRAVVAASRMRQRHPPQLMRPGTSRPCDPVATPLHGHVATATGPPLATGVAATGLSPADLEAFIAEVQAEQQQQQQCRRGDAWTDVIVDELDHRQSYYMN